MKKFRLTTSKLTIFIFPFTLLFTFFIRFLYHLNNTLYFYFPDTFHYINRAEEMARSLPLVNPFRMPLYPYILKVLLHLDGQTVIDRTNISSLSFIPILQFQQLMGIIGSLLFLLIAKRILEVSGRS